MDPERLVMMGRCARPHGVRGEVKVVPETDDPQRFRALERLFVGPEPGQAARAARAVEAVRFQPFRGGSVTVLLKLAGSDTREDAADLRGLGVYAGRDDLPPLGPGEMLVSDLVGLDVFAVAGAAEGEPDAEPDAQPVPVGRVRDVLDGAAQLLLVVARDGAPDVLVPDVPEIVRDVDLAAGRVLIDPPEGLFDA